MALGGSNTDDFKDYHLFFTRVRGLKAGETVRVEVVDSNLKDENGKFKRVEDTRSVEGLVTKLDMEEREYQGEIITSFKVWLRDDQMKESYSHEFGLNSLGRGIINTLASTGGKLGRVCFSYYTNKKGRPSAFITNDGEQISWKYSWEHLSENKFVVPVEKKVRTKDGFEKKTVYDNTAFDELILKEFKELQENFKPVPVEKKEEESNNDKLPDAFNDDDEGDTSFPPSSSSNEKEELLF